jgi:hypothetical protein
MSGEDIVMVAKEIGTANPVSGVSMGVRDRQVEQWADLPRHRRYQSGLFVEDEGLVL